jgi:hypothetical protein
MKLMPDLVRFLWISSGFYDVPTFPAAFRILKSPPKPPGAPNPKPQDEDLLDSLEASPRPAMPVDHADFLSV